MLYAEKKCVLMVCPGIANSSESLYIKTLIDYAQKSGFWSVNKALLLKPILTFNLSLKQLLNS